MIRVYSPLSSYNPRVHKLNQEKNFHHQFKVTTESDRYRGINQFTQLYDFFNRYIFLVILKILDSSIQI